MERVVSSVGRSSGMARGVIPPCCHLCGGPVCVLVMLPAWCGKCPWPAVAPKAPGEAQGETPCESGVLR